MTPIWTICTSGRAAGWHTTSAEKGDDADPEVLRQCAAAGASLGAREDVALHSLSYPACGPVAVRGLSRADPAYPYFRRAVPVV